mmetsp:Transcript_9849/g.36726  ORF Transcript_9849/g.36726 Transcript_9849/m.36726 type:complete len:330 (-) Transcript_9849:991-1980(-)
MAHVKPTKYGMEMIKKTLDMLMGVNRNGDRPDAIIDSYRDRRVCKYDLVGLCPHQLFPNTRQHLGACKAQCCPAPQHLKQQFQEDLENDDPLCWRFVKDAERFYSDLVGKCDEKKQLHQFRLDEQNKQAGHVAPLENAELKATIERMEELTGLVEKLGEEGKIDEAQQRMQELDHLTKRKEELEAYIKPKTNQQELLVCDICAAILSVNETDQRLADHFAGKSHIGYVKLREKAKELGEKLKEHFEKSGGRANSYDSYQDRREYRSGSRGFREGSHRGGGGYRGGGRGRSPFRGDGRKRYREYSHERDYPQRGGYDRGPSPGYKRRRFQ